MEMKKEGFSKQNAKSKVGKNNLAIWGNRFLSIFIAGLFICVLLLAPATVVLANEEPLPLYIRQASINKPEVTVYFDLPDDLPNSGNFNMEELLATASLAGEELTPVSLEPFEDSGEGVWYIFVIDVSTSMKSNQIAAIRGSIEDIAGNLGKSDRFTLISFGVTVDVLVDLSGNEQEIIDAADTLRANQRGTLFYDSIVKAFELAAQHGAGIPERRAVFVFSDAGDVNVGGYIRQEVEDLLAKTDVALYAMGFNNVTRDALDAFGAKARMTPDGGIDVVTHSTVRDAVRVRTDSMKSGYVARFTSRTNMTGSEPETLILDVGSAETAVFRAAADVTPTRWIPDHTPPEIKSAQQTASETIQIEFSKPMLGADKPEGYHIEDTDGNLVVVRAVTYNDVDFFTTIAIDTPPRSGKLKISFPGITDESMERNVPEQSVTIEFKVEEAASAPPPVDPTPPPVEIKEPIPPLVWLFGSLLIALVVVGVSMAVIKSRGGLVKVDGKLRFAGNPKEEVFISEEKVEAEQYKFITTKPPEINLRIMDGSGRTRDISTPVQGSLFIGRAAGNDIVFDDKRMSRQHFAIEAKNGSFSIINLSETGGTMLNGVKIGSPRPLAKSDRIEAGSITFTVI